MSFWRYSAPGFQIAFDEVPSGASGVSISIMIPFRYPGTSRGDPKMDSLPRSSRKYCLSRFSPRRRNSSLISGTIGVDRKGETVHTYGGAGRTGRQ